MLNFNQMINEFTESAKDKSPEKVEDVLTRREFNKQQEATKKAQFASPKIDPVVAWLAAQNDVQEFHLDNNGFVCIDKNCNCINKNNPVKGGEIIDAEVEETEDSIQQWLNK